MENLLPGRYLILDLHPPHPPHPPHFPLPLSHTPPPPTTPSKSLHIPPFSNFIPSTTIESGGLSYVGHGGKKTRKLFFAPLRSLFPFLSLCPTLSPEFYSPPSDGNNMCLTKTPRHPFRKQLCGLPVFRLFVLPGKAMPKCCVIAVLRLQPQSEIICLFANGLFAKTDWE